MLSLGILMPISSDKPPPLGIIMGFPDSSPNPVSPVAVAHDTPICKSWLAVVPFLISALKRGKASHTVIFSQRGIPSKEILSHASKSNAWLFAAPGLNQPAPPPPPIRRRASSLAVSCKISLLLRAGERKPVHWRLTNRYLRKGFDNLKLT